MKTDFLSNAELRIACSINASKLAYGQRFLRFARNLRQHCFDESNRVEHFSNLVPRGSDLVAAVEHFLNFLDFCSTFEAARLSFEEPGRQKSGIYPETKNDRAFDTIVR